MTNTALEAIASTCDKNKRSDSRIASIVRGSRIAIFLLPVNQLRLRVLDYVAFRPVPQLWALLVLQNNQNNKSQNKNKKHTEDEEEEEDDDDEEKEEYDEKKTNEHT